MLGDGEQAIVADPLAPGRPLLRLNGADHPTCHDATDRHRHVEQHEHVECIAVLGDRRWNEVEIIGKRQAGRQHPPEVESSSVRIVAVLVAAPLGVSMTIVRSPISGSHVGSSESGLMARPARAYERRFFRRRDWPDSDIAIATACLRLFTRRPEPPLLSLPRLYSPMTLPTLRRRPLLALAMSILDCGDPSKAQRSRTPSGSAHAKGGNQRCGSTGGAVSSKAVQPPSR